MITLVRIVAVLALLTLLACGTEGSATGGTPSPPQSAGTVVTLRVGGSEEYRLLLTDPEDIAVARQWYCI